VEGYQPLTGENVPMSRPIRSLLLAPLGLAIALSAAVVLPASAQDTKAPAAQSTTAPEAAKPTPQPAPDTLLATVNGEKITEADIEIAETDLDPQFARLPPEQRRAAALSALIEIHVIADKAKSEGIDKDPDVKRRIALLDLRALHSAYVDRDIASKITEEELKKRYDEEIAKTPPVNEIHARHILVKTKEEAEAIIKELDKGADFEKLAKEKSTDGAAPEGGDLGWFSQGQMVPEFDKAAFALKVGQYTEQPVHTQFGWHIIKVEDKRVKQPPSFDQVKNQIKQLVLRDKYFAAVNAARSAAKVDIADPALKKQVDAMDKAQ
jgi:peptidyl-prolyl cis-trans isomerase C